MKGNSLIAILVRIYCKTLILQCYLLFRQVVAKLMPPQSHIRVPARLHVHIRVSVES